MNEFDYDVPVLIVGGGPAGLTAAMELGRRGIDGLLIERRDFSTHFPRAHLLNVRTMEIFNDIGAAEDIYKLSPPEDQWRRVAWYLGFGDTPEGAGTRVGYLDAWGGGADIPRYRLASPMPFANVPQIRLDDLLWRHALEVWPDAILGDTELISLDQDDSHVIARVRSRKTEQDLTVRAQYVIGADGGRTVNDLVGIDVIGPRALRDQTSVHFTADLSEHVDPIALLTYIMNPDVRGGVGGGLLALGPHNWGARSEEWVCSFHGDGTHDFREWTETEVVEHARRLLGVPDLEMDVHSISHWQFEGVVAERFREGRVFIAGDAAHRHPPTGGLGLNTAVGDIGNLAWKLASVLKGQASPALLDSYELERQPVAARNVEHSLLNAGRHEPIAQAVGLSPEKDVEQNWAEVQTWLGSSDESRQRQEAVSAAVQHNAEDYSQLNIEAGFVYHAGALIPEADGATQRNDSATEYVPSAEPGSHIPHVWLVKDGQRVSTNDLVEAEGLTLFTVAPQAWESAAQSAQRATGVPVAVVAIGEGAWQVEDGSAWEDISGTTGGHLLVRPDRHVAVRRAEAASADASEQLTETVRKLMHEPPSTTGFDTVFLDGVAAAGERIRVTGKVREAHIFAET